MSNCCVVCRCVDMVITELGVFERRDGELCLTELDPEVSLEEVRAATGYNFRVAEDLKPMQQL